MANAKARRDGLQAPLPTRRDLPLDPTRYPPYHNTQGGCGKWSMPDFFATHLFEDASEMPTASPLFGVLGGSA